MNASTTSIPSAKRPLLARRWVWWVVGAAAGFLVLAAAYALYSAMRMDAVPPGLDYGTTRLSEGGLYQVSYVPSIAEVPVNQLHAWTLHVETPDGRPLAEAEISVDGDMPQHGHGLPTRPLVTQDLGNGDYLVEGMKFQMGGWWVVDFTITAEGQTDKVSFNLRLLQ